jgi:hypothetical protein
LCHRAGLGFRGFAPQALNRVQAGLRSGFEQNYASQLVSRKCLYLSGLSGCAEETAAFERRRRGRPAAIVLSSYLLDATRPNRLWFH